MGNTYPITAAKTDEVYRFSDDARALYGDDPHTMGLFRVIDTRLRGGVYQLRLCQIGHDGDRVCLLAGTEFWDEFGDMVAA